MPEITLSLPAALGLLALFLTIGAVLVYFALQQTGNVIIDPTETATPTLTATMTVTPTSMPPTATSTPLPTPTPLSYQVKLGDTCGGIAFAFGVSVQSIVLLNNLPADCSTLVEGQSLLIPQPTPTSTPFPTATLDPTEQFYEDCRKVEYTVQENDTLSGIAINYAVSVEAIQDFNGLVNNVVRFGQQLVIPLCLQNTPEGQATSTPTPPPPYAAVNLLLPADGAAFSGADNAVTLQWASVGALRPNEKYQVTIEDITEGEGRKLVDYVDDTKFIVPQSYRPNDTVPHVLRWSVVPVRQVGTDDDGNPIWEPAGAVSELRVFTWFGAGAPPTAVP
jgi:LysM repeat protein